MVRMYILDGRMLTSREAMHDHLYMVFNLPEYYGRNLDALWDCLGEKKPGVIVIQRAEKADGDCLANLMRLFMDLVRETPEWELNLSTGNPDCHAHGFAPESDCDGDCAHCSESCPQPDESGKAGASSGEQRFRPDRMEPVCVYGPPAFFETGEPAEKEQAGADSIDKPEDSHPGSTDADVPSENTEEAEGALKNFFKNLFGAEDSEK